MKFTEAILPTLNTRHLLKALRMTRAFDSRLHGTIDRILEMRDMPPAERVDDDKNIIVDAWLLGGLFHGDTSEITVAQLKVELAKREHVPNKQESIELRKAKNLRGRQKGRCDR